MPTSKAKRTPKKPVLVEVMLTWDKFGEISLEKRFESIPGLCLGMEFWIEYIDTTKIKSIVFDESTLTTLVYLESVACENKEEAAECAEDIVGNGWVITNWCDNEAFIEQEMRSLLFNMAGPVISQPGGLG